MAKKIRLDVLLLEQGLAETRSKAQSLILAGRVYSGDRRLDKAGHQLPADTELRLTGKDHPWVSRGGIKLAHALEEFGTEVAGRIALDIGASTGGFTDVLLSHDIAQVFAVDVGHGQFAWKLRTDARVSLLEKTNARYLDREHIPLPVDLVVADVSFISLKTVLPAALALTAADADLIALIKPQFEVGQGLVGKGGVVRDPALHREVCDDITGWLENQPGWRPVGLVKSPITGPEGNIEFLIAARKNGRATD